jgi:cell division transport system ATP-binding protein
MSTQTNNTLIKYNGVEICQKEQVVLKDVSIEISAGEFYYLIGSVGSGKSSLLKTIYAELPITEGDAQVFDFDLNEIKHKEIPFLRRQMGIIFQDFQLLMDRTVYDNLYFVLKATD